MAFLFSICLGVGLGIVPLLSAAFNGLVIGLAGYNILPGEGLTFFVLGVLPHGILEVPLLLLSTAIGIKVGFGTLKKILGRESFFKENLKNGLKFYGIVILPLTLLTAFIEVFITPLFL